MSPGGLQGAGPVARAAGTRVSSTRRTPHHHPRRPVSPRRPLALALILAALAPSAAGAQFLGGRRGMPAPPQEFRLPSFPKANEILANDAAKRLLDQKDKLRLTDAQVATLVAIGDSLFTANGDALYQYDRAQRTIRPHTQIGSPPPDSVVRSYRDAMPAMLVAMDRVVANEERFGAAALAVLDAAQRERGEAIIAKRRSQLVDWRKPLEVVRPREGN